MMSYFVYLNYAVNDYYFYLVKLSNLATYINEEKDNAALRLIRLPLQIPTAGNGIVDMWLLVGIWLVAVGADKNVSYEVITT